VVGRLLNLSPGGKEGGILQEQRSVAKDIPVQMGGTQGRTGNRINSTSGKEGKSR